MTQEDAQKMLVLYKKTFAHDKYNLAKLDEKDGKAIVDIVTKMQSEIGTPHLVDKSFLKRKDNAEFVASAGLKDGDVFLEDASQENDGRNVPVESTKKNDKPAKKPIDTPKQVEVEHVMYQGKPVIEKRNTMINGKTYLVVRVSTGEEYTITPEDFKKDSNK